MALGRDDLLLVCGWVLSVSGTVPALVHAAPEDVLADCADHHTLGPWAVLGVLATVDLTLETRGELLDALDDGFVFVADHVGVVGPRGVSDDTALIVLIGTDGEVIAGCSDDDLEVGVARSLANLEGVSVVECLLAGEARIRTSFSNRLHGLHEA